MSEMNVMYIGNNSHRISDKTWIIVEQKDMIMEKIKEYIEEQDVWYLIIDGSVKGLEWVIRNYPNMIVILINPKEDLDLYINELYVSNGINYKNWHYNGLHKVEEGGCIYKIERFINYHF